MNASEWYLEVNGNKVGPFTFDQIQGLLEDGEIRPYHQVTSEKTENQWISVEELLASFGSPPPPPMSFEDQPTDPDLQAPKKAAQEFEFSLDPEAAPENESENDTDSNDGPQLKSKSTETRTPQPVPAHFDLSFQPPPRPDLLTESQGPIPGSIPESDVDDPALTLFNAIQTVRERRSQPINPAPMKDFGRKKSIFKLPSMMKKPEVMSKVMPKVAAVRAAIPPVPARLWWTAIAAGILLGSISWGMIRLLKNHGQSGSGTLTQVKEPTGVFHPSESKPKPFERHAPPVAAAPQSHQAPPPPPPASKPNEAEQKDPRDNENSYPPPDEREATEANPGNPGAPPNQPIPNHLPNQANPNNPYLNANQNPYGAPELNPLPPGDPNAVPPGGAVPYPGQNDAGAFTPPPAPQMDPNTGAPVIANPGNNPYLQEGQTQPQDPNAGQPPGGNAPGQDAFPPPQQ